MLNLFNAVRGYLGMALGLAITVASATTALVLGSIWRALLPGRYNPVALIVVPWSWLVHFLCYRFIMGLKIKIDPIPPEQEERARVAYGPHPPLELVPAFGYFASLVSPKMKVVGRKDIVKGWLGFLIGKGAAASGILFPIERDNHDQALKDIEEGLRLLEPGTVLFILPDRHRPSQKHVDASRAKHGERFPEVLLWETCMPDRGGLLAILRGYDRLKKPVQLLRFSAGFNRPMKGGAEITKLPGATLRYRVVESDGAAFPRGEAEAGARLRAEWQEHHEDLAAYRQQRE